jgi:hypothetical protein
MRSRRDLQRVPVLMLSLLADPGPLREAEGLGASGLLIKSRASLHDVMDRVRRLVPAPTVPPRGDEPTRL